MPIKQAYTEPNARCTITRNVVRGTWYVVRISGAIMIKKNSSTIPDFSRKRPAAAGAKPAVTGDKAHTPNPRQPQKAPTKAKNGGRRGT